MHLYTDLTTFFQNGPLRRGLKLALVAAKMLAELYLIVLLPRNPSLDWSCEIHRL